jgi:NADPH-dependent 2,4-dienoyl-CoA reductase/sulfur reductase-like enzyme
VGVRPDAELAAGAGAETGVRGAIRVNRRMETNLPDILAAGDCVETYHRILDGPAYLPLGTTAHKQGRVAGENAVGGDREFEGSPGTQVVRVFDLAVARTGLRDEEARAGGFDPLTEASSALDHNAYYPEAHEIHMRFTGDRRAKRLLGAQPGHRQAEVPKRIDIAAVALFHGMTVDGLNDLDLSYAPPFGSPWDAVQAGAQVWTREAASLASAHEKSPALNRRPSRPG